MIVGVPKEVKTAAHRIALTPVGVRELSDNGHSVLIGQEAGEGSMILDTDINQLRAIDSLYEGRIGTLHSNRLTLEDQVLNADLVVGAVLIPGPSGPSSSPKIWFGQ